MNVDNSNSSSAPSDISPSDKENIDKLEKLKDRRFELSLWFLATIVLVNGAPLLAILSSPKVDDLIPFPAIFLVTPIILMVLFAAVTIEAGGQHARDIAEGRPHKQHRILLGYLNFSPWAAFLSFLIGVIWLGMLLNETPLDSMPKPAAENTIIINGPIMEQTGSVPQECDTLEGDGACASGRF